jgi:DNA-binding beta-propeller fold protein YncE
MELLGAGGAAKLIHPFGVGVDAEGDVYVADQRADEIVVLDGKGRLQRRFGKEKLQGPTALALDRKRQVLYVLNGMSSLKTDHRIEAFSLKGDHLRTIGKRGSGQGEFNFASHLTVAPDGRIFVSDMLNFRVQVLDPEGGYVSSFGSIGAGGPGFFDKSKGIALDTFGNVYVADALHGVQIFNPTFQPLMFFGEGFIQTPTGLVIDSRNHIFVSDPVSPFVHEFVLINTTAEDSFPPRLPAQNPNPPAGDAAKSPTGG